MIVISFLILVASIASIHCASFAWVVTLRFTNPLLNAGEQLTLTCTVRNVTRSHTVHFMKEGRSGNGSVVLYDLSTNEESHYDMSNYQISSTEYGADVDYVLTMPATSGSTGNYTCAVRNSTTLLSNLTAEVNVLNMPTSVRLLVNNQDVTNMTVNLTLGSSYNLQCIVNGSNPSANIQIMHGNQNLTSQITSLVNGTAMYTPSMDSSSPFLQPVTRSTNATISAWKIDVTYLDAPLTCSAQLPSFMPQVASFVPKIADAPPQFICNDTFLIPKQTSNVFQFTCMVYSRPPLTGAAFSCISPACGEFNGLPAGFWYPTSGGDTVFSGFVQPINFTRPIFTDPMNITRANMTLKIQTIPGDKLVGRTFNFKAVNSMGTVMHQIKLTDTVPTTIGATRAVSTSTTLLICAMVLIKTVFN